MLNPDEYRSRRQSGYISLSNGETCTTVRKLNKVVLSRAENDKELRLPKFARKAGWKSLALGTKGTLPWAKAEQLCERSKKYTWWGNLQHYCMSGALRKRLDACRCSHGRVTKTNNIQQQILRLSYSKVFGMFDDGGLKDYSTSTDRWTRLQKKMKLVRIQDGESGAGGVVDVLHVFAEKPLTTRPLIGGDGEDSTRGIFYSSERR